MSEDRTLTFSQRTGYEPLPALLELGELSDEARTGIWNVLYREIETSKQWSLRLSYVGEPWQTVLRDVYWCHYNMPLDEWNANFDRVTGWMRRQLETERFNHVFDVIEFLMRHRYCPRRLIADLSATFRRFQLAYIIDPGRPPAISGTTTAYGTVELQSEGGRPPTIFPAATADERDQLIRNLTELHSARLDGCTVHLGKASKCINGGDSAGSVRESIHAVESVARQIDPEASKMLGPALTSLEKRSTLHPTLKVAFNNLYGYTNREQGIRHALLDNAQANVTIDEAVFMLGACASFASYLWRKHKAATAP